MNDRVHFPPPYYAVIFTSKRTDVAADYAETNDLLISVAKEMQGYLGEESARDATLGVSVSFWKDLASIKIFKEQVDHKMAQARGRQEWYTSYRVRIALVEREYDFSS
jgi:heme-degrading monooxygenase HmoA